MDANTTFNLDLKLIPCGPTNEFFDLSNAGIFYTMIGTGAKMRITSCSTEAQFISRVSVFTSCDSNSCVDSAAETKVEGGSNTTCFDDESKAVLEFQSVAGVEYSLFVQDDTAGISGDFAMFVDELPPENAFCNSPPVLEMDKTYTGTTGGSVTSTTAPACNGTSPDGPGVWFAIPGEMDDTEVVMVVCSEQPFSFLVYSSSCSDLSCVDVKPKVEEARLCGDGSIESRVAWIPNKGESYYVHMFGDDGANFRLAFGRPLMRNDSSSGSISGKIAGGLVATTIARLVFAMLTL
ncbi:unnamed protein product [Cylindrotheca closterium]|uniref:Uncharacterized protein n=1 Tax=Cylindrotheca closterium TaxID=2856 RepID=A0AAD2FR87_9STRA|nr:unnamed protein product [Cylindrotheca closterium]